MNYVLISGLLLLLSLFAFFEKEMHFKIRAVIYIFFCTVFSVVFALRNPYTTPDTSEYIRVFGVAHYTDGFFSQIERYESGFCAMIRIVKGSFNNYQVLFFLVSIISFIFLLFVVKRVSKPGDGSSFLPITFLIMYLPYFGLLYNSIVIRACMAISLLYCSAYCIKGGKKSVGVVLYILSVMFHQTMILALPILIIEYCNIRLKKSVAKITLVILFILNILNIGELTTNLLSDITKYLYSHFSQISLLWWANHYLTSKASDGAFSAFRLFLFLLMLFLSSRDDRDDRVSAEVVIGIVGMIILILFGNLSIVSRLSEIYIIAISFEMYRLVSTQRDKFIIELNQNMKLQVPNFVFVFSVSLLFYIIFLRNVAIPLNQL